MTAYAAREELADILERELLGPTEPEEVLPVAPDTRYLIGRIAPVRLVGDAHDPVSAETEVGDVVLADDLDARDVRGVAVGSDDETSADGDNDAAIAEDAPIKRGLMIPASMGLRFQVPDDLPAVRVTASWGTYAPEKAEPAASDTKGAAARQRGFRRTHHERPIDVPLAQLADGDTWDETVDGSVVLRVDVHHDAARSRRLVEIALCNDRETPRRIPTDAWLFQTRLEVDAGGAEAFLPVSDALEDDTWEPNDEVRRLNLQYRDRLAFAIGRTCSADWTTRAAAPGEPVPRRATSVRTTWLPSVSTPQVRAADVAGAELDMTRLARAGVEELEAGLRPIVHAYARWLDGREAEASALPAHLAEEGLEAVAEARQVADQLADGVDYLLAPENDEARRCFAFMNHVMAEQRIQSQVIEKRKDDPGLTPAAARDAIVGPAVAPEKRARAHSWRMFQLAFVLMQLRALCEPGTERRSGDLAQVELLFFPTGGGKTEAYLGLAAFAFAIRRRQGVLDTADGPLDGRDGVTVLMRYTLRLLTAQQFQRAATLVCAAELERRAHPGLWGDTPFRIGLWVGTDVSPKRVAEAAKEVNAAHNRDAGAGHRLTVLQVRRCPWCGTPIGAGQVKVDTDEGRVRVRCGDDLRRCPFALGAQVPDGLPILTVDEEIYRLVPAFVIATVDKFARLAREGAAAALFGHVATRCTRHGYVHADDAGCASGRHNAKGPLPAATRHPATRLRPPDLIIQDELHLITGALGTTVGLFEVAMEAMTAWRTPGGEPARPLVVASSATVRNARDQVRNLYGRGVTIFPPQVLDAASTFFSEEVPVSEQDPGRRYVGVSTTGVRLTAAEIRVASVLMAGAQHLLDTVGSDADPYATLVAYFNATRELAGMSRYMSDDIATTLKTRLPGSPLPPRFGTGWTALTIGELAGRASNADITATLDDLAIGFDPDFDSNPGRAARGKAREAGEALPNRDGPRPFDAVLATSMLQVGVDVQRLGLMLIVGQPKNTAEYIQASSRVGRDPGRPGLVVTLGNWARPRDLAHFEQFRQYHESFYASVEPLSVTPFSSTSLDRGLDGVLVSAARVLQAAFPPRDNGLSPEASAGLVVEQRPWLENLVDALVARIERSGAGEATDHARGRLVSRLSAWEERRDQVSHAGLQLVYERVVDESRHAALLRGPETMTRSAGAGGGLSQAPFVVANSMREVQPEINLLVSPDPDRLYVDDRAFAPAWAPRPKDDNA